MKLLTGEGGGGGGKTVVVGVKLDSHSKELLTWALVKVAEPGDNVIAIHVLEDHLHTPSGLLSLSLSLSHCGLFVIFLFFFCGFLCSVE